jgi:hypothetical protein
VLGEILGPGKDEVKVAWAQLNSGEFHNLN